MILDEAKMREMSCLTYSTQKERDAFMTCFHRMKKSFEQSLPTAENTKEKATSYLGDPGPIIGACRYSQPFVDGVAWAIDFIKSNAKV